MMNRRALLFAPALLIGSAQASESLLFNEPIVNGDTTIIIFRDEPSMPANSFSVGVQSRVKGASHALVECFYETEHPDFKGKLTLHQELIAPVASELGFGATTPFHLPAPLKFIRVQLFQDLGSVEFGR